MSTNIPALKTAKNIDRDADVVVVDLTNVGETPILVGVLADLEKAWNEQLPSPLLGTVVVLGTRSEPGTLTVLPPVPQRLVAAGLGDADITPSVLRHACGIALQKTSGTKDAENLNVTTSLELYDPELARAVMEGAALSAYCILRITQKPRKSSAAAIMLVTGRAQLRESVEEAGVIVIAVIQAHDWINTSPNLLCPETFAESARARVSGLEIGVETFDERALVEGGYGGILAMGGSSSRSLRLLHLTWAPRGAKFHLVSVGKGITFGSGGLDIKPTGQMASMTCDMLGAAAVTVATQAITALGLLVKVTIYATMAESLSSSTAYCFTDVLAMFDGTTVENTNTDAEGHPVVVDVLGRVDTDPPNLTADVVTLTGACMVTLGKYTVGLMVSGGATTDRLPDTAEAAGKSFRHLSITDSIREDFKPDVADLRSSGKDHYGGALAAAAFLQRFIPEGVLWAYLDTAGPTWNDESPYGHTPLDGIGTTMHTLVVLMTRLAG